jgi:hypothetical protein
MKGGGTRPRLVICLHIGFNDTDGDPRRAAFRRNAARRLASSRAAQHGATLDVAVLRCSGLMEVPC